MNEEWGSRARMRDAECVRHNEIELSGSQARYVATHPCPLLQREGVERSEK